MNTKEEIFNLNEYIFIIVSILKPIKIKYFKKDLKIKILFIL